MCEANAYLKRGEREELLLASVDVVQPLEGGGYLLVDIFGNQKTVAGRLKRMELVAHRLIFEPAEGP